jgi:hypothetical protein
VVKIEGVLNQIGDYSRLWMWQRDGEREGGRVERRDAGENWTLWRGGLKDPGERLEGTAARLLYVKDRD